MKSTQQEKLHFLRLFNKSVDGRITDDEIEHFNHLLSSFPDLESYYLKCVRLQVALRDIPIPSQFDLTETPLMQDRFWEKIAAHEKNARTIEITADGLRQEDLYLHPADGVRRRKPLSIRARVVFLAKLAAILMLAVSVVLLDRWFQKKMAGPGTRVVARLTDQINPEWNNSLNRPHADGQMEQDRYGLRSGVVKIQLNHGAEIVVEGPAEWSLKTEDNLYLHHGSVYARIPTQAIGFSINTESGKIIDLGTEFGVCVHKTQDMELHVIDGQTHLIAGRNGPSNNSRPITAGQARYVDSVNRQVREIPVDEQAFIRRIDSASKTVWRGRNLSLADILTGGNGFGRADSLVGIVPHTGELIPNPLESHRHTELYEYRYMPVANLKYVDGVFVPHAGEGGIVVSSAGHTFLDCPRVHGSYFGKCITNGNTKETLYLQGIPYGPKNNPVINMQRNKGITFDLEAIRRSLPGLEITRFRSLFGFCDRVREKYSSEKSFNRTMKVAAYVLVDGEKRFCREGFGIYNEPAFIEIELAPDDRFLTLMTAYEKIGTHNLSFFAGPDLILK